jgi:2-haloacid dehalogenase
LEKHFDHVISVEEVGIYKPSRRVYRSALHHLKLHDAPSVCFVSGNSWDGQAAAQFGFQAVKIERSPGFDDRIPGKPVARIKSLAELPGLL